MAFRRSWTWVVVWVLIMGTPGWVRADSLQWVPPVTTYSIVAIDPDANEMGAAVQSCYFVVGPTVIWAEAGVGVVATQAYVDIGYGPWGLALMRGGKSAPEALQALLAADPDRELRQVAMVDTAGNIAVHTGRRATPAAGHKKGSNYSVQGNLLVSEAVWEAMARAFEETRGSLAERFMAALEGAEAEGGDLRCRQSAAVKIVRIRPEGPSWRSVVLDLRVDDHPEPVRELRRLLNVWQGIQLLRTSLRKIRAGDFTGARRAFEKARTRVPGKTEWTFWYGTYLVLHDQVEQGLSILREIAAKESQWLELWKRLPGTGRFQFEEGVWERVYRAMESATRNR